MHGNGKAAWSHIYALLARILTNVKTLFPTTSQGKTVHGKLNNNQRPEAEAL